MSSSIPNSLPGRPTPHLKYGIRLIFVVIAAIAAVLALRINRVQRQTQVIEHVKRLGGKVETDVVPEPLPEWLNTLQLHVISGVDLSHTDVRGIDLQPLHRIASIKQLDLDDTDLTAGDGIYLQPFSSLEFLSLSGTNLSDRDLISLKGLRRLRFLSLRGVPITDEGISHLAALSPLETLDLVGTKLQPASLRALASLPNLQNLSLSEDRINEETLTALKDLRGLRQIFVDVPAGYGKKARNLLATLSSVEATGMMHNGSAVLWKASARWDATTAGVAELVADAVGLEPEETVKLVTIFSRMGLSGEWPRERAPETGFSVPHQSAPDVPPITSLEEFIEELRTTNNWPDARLAEYAREGITSSDVQKLVESVRNKGWHNQSHKYLRFVLPMLVRHGLEREGVEETLRELLSDEPGLLSPPSPLSHWHAAEIPKLTAYALNTKHPWFGYGRAMTESEARIALRLLRPHAQRTDPPADGVYAEFRNAVIDSLAAIATPGTGGEIMPLLVNRLAEGRGSAALIGQVARAAPAAALTALPDLYKLLDHPVRASAVEAIGYAAAVDEAAARTAAKACLDRLGEGGEASKGAAAALGHLVTGSASQETTRGILRELMRKADTLPAMVDPVYKPMTNVVNSIRTKLDRSAIRDDHPKPQPNAGQEEIRAPY